MNNQKILLIDYDPASISKTATPLTKAGYSVEVAKDGLSGLAAFERMKPALVLVEAMLPRKHGFEVCQEIKAMPDGKSTPVLITSAVCRGRKYRMDALQIYGCDEYIEKPIPDSELVTLIQRLIDQAAHATEEVKQDLSAAIDSAATDAPEAIESMSDDELEAKIDSLLVGDETDTAEAVAAPPPPAEAAPSAAPDPEPEPDSENEMPIVATSDHEAVEDLAGDSEPDMEIVATSDHEVVEEATGDPEPDMEIVATSDHEVAEGFAGDPETATAIVATSDREVVEEAEPVDEPAFDAATELDRRVEAMVQVDAEKIDSPLIDPLPEVAEDPFEIEQSTRDPAEAPPLAGDATATSDKAVPEWTETATPAKGGSKTILFAVAAVVVLGVAGFLAFRQGWIGGNTETAARVATPTVEPAGSVVAEPEPEPAPATPNPTVTASQPASSDPTSSEFAAADPGESPPSAVEPEPEPVEVARAVELRPELPPKPAPYKGRSAAEREALENRKREAEQAMVAAAGSLQSALLSENVPEPVADTDAAAAPANVDVDLIGTPEPPKPSRGQLFDSTDVDTMPVKKRFTQPVYDELARMMRHEGEVVVSVLVDENGKVADVELIKGIPRSRLNDATVSAARRWTYDPATKGGVPVSVWKTERILFTLE